jgi:hypothetical protein
VENAPPHHDEGAAGTEHEGLAAVIAAGGGTKVECRALGSVDAERATAQLAGDVPDGQRAFAGGKQSVMGRLGGSSSKLAPMRLP